MCLIKIVFQLNSWIKYNIIEGTRCHRGATRPRNSHSGEVQGVWYGATTYLTGTVRIHP